MKKSNKKNNKEIKININQKIKTLNTQGILPTKKKINIQNLNLLNSASNNESSKKNSLISERIKFTDVNKLVKTYNKESNNNNSTENFNSQNSSTQNRGKYFQMKFKEKKKRISDDEEESNEILKPFDLSSLLFIPYCNDLKDLKEDINKELNLKKIKYKIKKNKYSINKNDNYLNLELIKVNNDFNECGNNFFVIKGIKKHGNNFFCKDIIRNIISKYN